jgi:hypothetical protein
MGSYASLNIGDFVIHESKNHVDSICTILFTEGDKCFSHVDTDDEGHPLGNFVYRTTVACAVERLEVLGFTLDKSRQEFEEGVNAIFKSRWQLHLRAQHFSDENDQWQIDYYESVKRERELDFCQSYKFEAWLKVTMEELIHKGVPLFSQPETMPLPIEEEFAEYFYGFPADPSYMLRALLEQFALKEAIVLDCTDLVNGGWMEWDDEACSVVPQIIILTEGPSDIDILQPTLSILYPHLKDYYSFMDFRTLKIEASASSLVKMVKVFAGAGIKQRMVAVFDNDAAAADALRPLQSDHLPENIRVVQLPDTPLARSYPTIGPQGAHLADVNGCACSIEMYLGEDILRLESSEFTPIKWGAFIHGVGKYQGEIVNKAQIQQKYLDLISLMKGNDRKSFPGHDWAGMHLVLSSIFGAFK